MHSVQQHLSISMPLAWQADCETLRHQQIEHSMLQPPALHILSLKLIVSPYLASSSMNALQFSLSLSISSWIFMRSVSPPVSMCSFLRFSLPSIRQNFSAWLPLVYDLSGVAVLSLFLSCLCIITKFQYHHRATVLLPSTFLPFIVGIKLLIIRVICNICGIMLARLLTQQARILIHNKFWMSIKIDNKLPTSEEEKQAMKQPYAVDKCPNKVQLEVGKDYWYCGCGLSKKQPFCDGSHKGTPFSPQKFTADKESAWICQCRQSKNKPFCDGTHKEIEF